MSDKKDKIIQDTPSNRWAQRLPGFPANNWEMTNGTMKIGATIVPLAVLTTVLTEIQTAGQQGRRIPHLGALMTRAFVPNFGMHAARGTTTLTGKSRTEDPELSTSPRTFRIIHFGSWVLADHITSQYHAAWAKLISANIAEKSFKAPSYPMKLRNLGRVMTLGFPIQLSIGAINLAFLFHGAPHFSTLFLNKNQDNKLTANMLGGAAAGYTAAFFSGPVKGLYDNMLQKSSIDKSTGELKTIGLSQFFKSHHDYAKSLTPRMFLNTVINRALFEIGHTGLRNASIFAIIQSMGYFLGKEPLAKFVAKPEEPDSNDMHPTMKRP